jgi:hypothetical protein
MIGPKQEAVCGGRTTAGSAPPGYRPLYHLVQCVIDVLTYNK